MNPILVGTWNVKRGGWSTTTRRHELDPVISHVATATPLPPAILGWPEATRYLDDGEAPLRRVTNLLSDWLPSEERYEPYVAQHCGHRNHPVIFVNTSVVEVVEWYVPEQPDTRAVMWGWLKATVTGIEDVWLSCQHWTGSAGPGAFTAHAAQVGEFAGRRSIVLGDFNQTSSWHREVQVDWHAATAAQPHRRWQKGVLRDGHWCLNTEGIDFLRDAGYRDLGELAGDPTPTGAGDLAELRIDRITISPSLPATLVPDSYMVWPLPLDRGRPVSDHRYVTAALAVGHDDPAVTR